MEAKSMTALDIPADSTKLLRLITGLFFMESNQPSKRFPPIAVAPVFTLDEGTLLKIFGFLSLEDLLRASLVCRWWYRLSFDRFLWKHIDLRRFSKSLYKPRNLQAFALHRLAGKIQCLDLSGFTITEESLTILAGQCNTLRVLKLRSATFATDANTNKKGRKETVMFPAHLHYLDIRFSHGNPRVYRAIASNLCNVKWLGICDAFFQALFAVGKLETTVDCMKDLRKLDASHCLSLKDSTLAVFKRCKSLEVLSVRKCSSLTGSFVQGFLESCTSLKTLILDGISIDDELLQSIKWGASSLKHLELGWCPLITSDGLMSALPRITKIPTLQFLGLCAVGDGKAMNDEILRTLAVSLSCLRCKNLKSLNLSSSRCITQNGLIAFQDLCMFVETLDTTNCPAIEELSLNMVKGLQTDQNNNVISAVESPRKRKGSISATQFARSKYTLETPL